MPIMPARPKKRTRTADYERRTITLPPDIDARLEELAEREDRPVSNLIARICREWLDSHDKRSKPQ